MKKTTLSIFTIFLFAFYANAQLVTIQGTNQFPVAGNIITYTNLNAFGFDAAGTGPVTTKVWDFSALATQGANTAFEYVLPSTLTAAQGADKFPTATIARKETGATGAFYYQNNPTNIDRLGFYGDATFWGVYTGGSKATEFKFPITAGQSFNSTYAGDFAPFNQGEDSVNISDGTLSITADMQGTMSLPSATFGTATNYTNVLRLHVVESFKINTIFGGAVVLSQTIADDYFYWFVESIKSPLLIYGITTLDGGSPSKVLRFQKASNLAIQNNTIAEIAQVSPNPSNGVFKLKGFNNDLTNTNVEIYNTLGALVYDSELTSTNDQIDISKEAKGIYFMKIANEKGTQTQKLIVE